MTRIIAGSAKGRTLKVPKSGTRPTPDRVRESIFSSLDHRLGSWQDLRVLDLFAGSGALGLEALSRGAASALLVDNARLAIDACRANLDATGLAGEVIQADVARWAARRAKLPSERAFDVVFADPPYEFAEGSITEILSDLVATAVLAEGAVVVLERGRRSDPTAWPAGFEELAERRFGDTVVRLGVWYLRRSPQT